MSLSQDFINFLKNYEAKILSSPSIFPRLFWMELFKNFLFHILIHPNFRLTTSPQAGNLARLSASLDGINYRNIQNYPEIIDKLKIEELLNTAEELKILGEFHIIEVIRCYLNSFMFMALSNYVYDSELLFKELEKHNAIESLMAIVRGLYPDKSPPLDLSFVYKVLKILIHLFIRGLLNDNNLVYNNLMLIRQLKLEDKVCLLMGSQRFNADSLDLLIIQHQGIAIDHVGLQAMVTDIVKKSLETLTSPANQADYLKLMRLVSYIQRYGQCPVELWNKIDSIVALKLFECYGKVYFADLYNEIVASDPNLDAEEVDERLLARVFGENIAYQHALSPKFTEYVNLGGTIQLLDFDLKPILETVEKSAGYKEYYDFVYQHILRPPRHFDFFASRQETLFALRDTDHRARRMFDEEWGLLPVSLRK